MIFIPGKNADIDYNKKTPYLSFPVLSEIPFIKHGFSTKLGGVSKGIFSTMNLSTHVGAYQDEPENVIENYKRISQSMGIDPNTIVLSKQVHKTDIMLVNKEDCGKGLFRPRDYDEIDGLITNTPGVTLVTSYADCVPLFFVDPIKKAIDLTHSGWRGTVAKIGWNTVKKMKEYFQSDSKDIIAVIGPSICMECFEIGEEVAIVFIKAFHLEKENPILYRKENGKYQCDLWAANYQVLIEAGLKPENIHISGVCTSCNSELLFSHRKTQGKRGSLAAFLMITDDI
jgi:YfiH family protein